jgi:hypothetical protein
VDVCPHSFLISVLDEGELPALLQSKRCPVSLLTPQPGWRLHGREETAAAAAGNVKTVCLSGHYIDRAIGASRNNNCTCCICFNISFFKFGMENFPLTFPQLMKKCIP